MIRQQRADSDPTLNIAAFAALEHAINAALAMDSATRKRLQSLDGNCFLLECTDPAIKVYVVVAEDRIRLPVFYDAKPATHLVGPMSEFITLATASDKPSALVNSGVRLQGDSAPLIRLADVLADIELDWEGELAKLVGDVPAHLFGAASRQLLQFGKRTHNTFLRHLEEYLHEEARLLPTRLEVEGFINDVQKLAQNVERIDARIKRLQQQIKAAQAKP
jgi:ubiquinone biosynthesis accessory factor UbiJ